MKRFQFLGRLIGRESVIVWAVRDEDDGAWGHTEYPRRLESLWSGKGALIHLTPIADKLPTLAALGWPDDPIPIRITVMRGKKVRKQGDLS